jgi:hypothetical protein
MSPRTQRRHLRLEQADLSQIDGIIGQRLGLGPEAFSPAPGRRFGQGPPNDLAAVGAVIRQWQR